MEDVKQCSSCGEDKPRSNFPKAKHGRICQHCKNAKQKEYRKQNGDVHTKSYEKTPKGYLMRTYRNMLSRTAGIQSKKAHLYEGLDLLSKEDFYDWAESENSFLTLFSDYKESGWEMKLAPSIDRIDSTKGYILDNMRWLTHSENSSLGAASKKRKEN